MIVKTPCQSCGTDIEFEAERAGEFVQCPSCQESTRLLLPSTSAHDPRPVNPRLIPCPDCSAAISRKALLCPQCGAAITVRFGFVWQIICAIALANLIFAAIGLVIYALFKAAQEIVQ